MIAKKYTTYHLFFSSRLEHQRAIDRSYAAAASGKRLRMRQKSPDSRSSARQLVRRHDKFGKHHPSPIDDHEMKTCDARCDWAKTTYLQLLGERTGYSRKQSKPTGVLLSLFFAMTNASHPSSAPTLFNAQRRTIGIAYLGITYKTGATVLQKHDWQ